MAWTAEVAAALRRTDPTRHLGPVGGQEAGLGHRRAPTWRSSDRRLFAIDVLPVVVEVDAVFDQTPGQGAGRCIGGQP